METSELCVKRFREIRADITINDIDIANRVPPRDKARRGPKPAVIKFTHRLAMNAVMGVRQEAKYLNSGKVGLYDKDLTELKCLTILVH